ncbi:hypothetical protein Zm00014a_028739 [Zea mays]|nr:hypothetical protein Zm00014a_028739 [Zea mays]PWZ38824.1 hypothetical protein Zm00014a_028739 [Zea mays]
MEDGSAPRRSTPPTRRSRSAEFHNFSERRRRDKINEKLKALQELLPNCNKTDKVSMLDEAIDYLKSLQLQLQMLVMGKGMSPVVPLELQQYMHYITADPAQLPPLRPSGQQPRQFQITQANPQRQSNVESDFLSQMQNLHSSEPPQNFLRPPKLQLYTPIFLCGERWKFKLLDQGYTVQMATLNRGVAYPARATTLDGFLGVPRITSWSDVLLMTKFDTAGVQPCTGKRLFSLGPAAWFT